MKYLIALFALLTGLTLTNGAQASDDLKSVLTNFDSTPMQISDAVLKSIEHASRNCTRTTVRRTSTTSTERTIDRSRGSNRDMSFYVDPLTDSKLNYSISVNLKSEETVSISYLYDSPYSESAPAVRTVEIKTNEDHTYVTEINICSECDKGPYEPHFEMQCRFEPRAEQPNCQ